MPVIEKKLKKQAIILHSKNIYKSILVLALPIFLSNLMKSLHNFIDMYFVANLVPEDIVRASINAISLSGPTIQITIALAGGFMVAGATIIAQYLGARKEQEARRTAGQLLVLCVLLGVFLQVLLFAFTPFIVQWMGAVELTQELMIKYIRIRSFEMVPLFTFFAFQASRQASGDTTTPVLYNFISVVINIFLTWYLIKFLHLGVVGSAIATLFANAIIMPFFIFMMFADKKAAVYLRKEDIVFQWEEIKKIFRIAWPVSVSQSLTSLGFLILNKLIVGFGENTISAFSIGNNIISLILMPVMGIGGVVATFVAQNIGASNEPRARESVKKSMILSVGIMLGGVLILLPLRRALAGIFLSNLPEAWNLAETYMLFLLTGLPLMAVFQVFMGVYQGSGETHYSLVLSLFRLWGMRIPLVLFYSRVLEMTYPDVIWYAMLISNFGTMILGTILYSFCKFQPKVPIQKQGELKHA